MEECPMTFINTYTTKFTGAFIARSKVLLAIAGILLLSVLIACAPTEDDDGGGGSDDTYTVGGTVTGHTGEVSLALTYGEKTETLKVAVGTDKFTFLAKLEANQSFMIAVTNPAGQSCSSSVTQGTIVDANITNVEIVCVVATYSVSGSVTGAVDNSQLTISLSHADAGTSPANIVTIDVVPNTDGTYSFDVPENRIYLLSVTSATTDEVCTPDVATFSAPITANVTDADIVCEPAAAGTYSISGTVSGLANGDVITLTLTPTGGNAETKVVTGDDVETANDPFAFDTAIAYDTAYEVTTTSPAGKTCRVAPAGSQTIGDADVTDIVVTCELTYSISGKVSGAADNSQITITLLHADLSISISVPTNIVTIETTPNTDGTFSIAVPENKYYLMVVDSANANEVCIPYLTTFSGPVTNGLRSFNITCSTAVATDYSVGGAVSGLVNGETIILTLSPTVGSVESKIITADADATTADNYAFNKKLANGATYTVTTTSTANKNCAVDNAGRQTMGDTDANIAVTCVTAYSISGTVAGATNNPNVYLVLTLSDDNVGTGASRQKVQAATDGTFTITNIRENKFYTLQAISTTVGETCSATPTTPTQVTANVTRSMVSCTASTGPVIRISLASFTDEASLTTVNVFIGDGAIPATTGNPPPTPTRVVNGSDTDVLIIPNIESFNAEGFRYDIPIDAGQYYAVTVDTASGTESCEIRTNGTGGPITDSLTVGITCR